MLAREIIVSNLIGNRFKVSLRLNQHAHMWCQSAGIVHGEYRAICGDMVTNHMASIRAENVQMTAAHQLTDPVQASIDDGMPINRA